MIELSHTELLILCNYYLQRRNYARDCRWTSRKKKDVRREQFWDREYRRHYKRIRQLRKAMKEVQ